MGVTPLSLLFGRQEKAVADPEAFRRGITIQKPEMSRSANWSRWNMTKALSDGYEISEWVHACINAQARPVASLPWRVSEFADGEAKARFEWELKGVPASQRSDFMHSAHMPQKRYGVYERKTHLEPLIGHALERLIEDPNRLMTRQELIQMMVQHLFLTGNALLWKGRGIGNVVLGLWPLIPSLVKPIEDPNLIIKGYEYKPNNKPQDAVTYDFADVAHVKFVDPGSLTWGIAPLMAAARSVDIDVEAGKWNKVSMQNRAVPDGVFIFDAKMDEDLMEETRRGVSAQYQGRGHAPLVMGNEAKWIDMARSPVEMDYLASRGFNRQAICSVLNTDPRVIKIVEDRMAANSEGVMADHWKTASIPLADLLASLFNKELAAEWGPNHLMWYDTSNVEALSESHHEKMRSAKVAHSMAVPFDEVNARYRLGYPSGMMGADVGWLPSGSVPVNLALEGYGFKPKDPSMNTPPDGGELVDPGTPNENVNDPDPEDINPEQGELSLNGHDLHEGRKRWTKEEARDRLERAGIEWEEMFDAKNHYCFVVEDLAKMKVADHELRNFHNGMSFGRDGVPEDIPEGTLNFYHGERNEERNLGLLASMQMWGWK